MSFLPRVQLFSSRKKSQSRTILDTEQMHGDSRDIDTDPDSESPRWMRMMTDMDSSSNHGSQWGQIFSRPAVRYIGQPNHNGFLSSSNLNGKALSSREASVSEPYKDELEPYFTINNTGSYTESLQSDKERKTNRRKNTIFLVLLLFGLIAIIAGITAAILWSIIDGTDSALSGRLEQPNNGQTLPDGGLNTVTGESIQPSSTIHELNNGHENTNNGLDAMTVKGSSLIPPSALDPSSVDVSSLSTINGITTSSNIMSGMIPVDSLSMQYLNLYVSSRNVDGSDNTDTTFNSEQSSSMSSQFKNDDKTITLEFRDIYIPSTSTQEFGSSIVVAKIDHFDILSQLNTPPSLYISHVKGGAFLDSSYIVDSSGVLSSGITSSGTVVDGRHDSNDTVDLLERSSDSSSIKTTASLLALNTMSREDKPSDTSVIETKQSTKASVIGKQLQNSAMMFDYIVGSELSGVFSVDKRSRVLYLESSFQNTDLTQSQGFNIMTHGVKDAITESHLADVPYDHLAFSTILNGDISNDFPHSVSVGDDGEIGLVSVDVSLPGNTGSFLPSITKLVREYVSRKNGASVDRQLSESVSFAVSAAQTHVESTRTLGSDSLNFETSEHVSDSLNPNIMKKEYESLTTSLNIPVSDGFTYTNIVFGNDDSLYRSNTVLKEVTFENSDPSSSMGNFMYPSSMGIGAYFTEIYSISHADTYFDISLDSFAITRTEMGPSVLQTFGTESITSISGIRDTLSSSYSIETEDKSFINSMVFDINNLALPSSVIVTVDDDAFDVSSSLSTFSVLTEKMYSTESLGSGGMSVADNSFSSSVLVEGQVGFTSAHIIFSLRLDDLSSITGSFIDKHTVLQSQTWGISDIVASEPLSVSVSENSTPEIPSSHHLSESSSVNPYIIGLESSTRETYDKSGFVWDHKTEDTPNRLSSNLVEVMVSSSVESFVVFSGEVTDKSFLQLISDSSDVMFHASTTFNLVDDSRASTSGESYDELGQVTLESSMDPSSFHSDIMLGTTTMSITSDESESLPHQEVTVNDTIQISDLSHFLPLVTSVSSKSTPSLLYLHTSDSNLMSTITSLAGTIGEETSLNSIIPMLSGKSQHTLLSISHVSAMSASNTFSPTLKVPHAPTGFHNTLTMMSNSYDVTEKATENSLNTATILHLTLPVSDTANSLTHINVLSSSIKYVNAGILTSTEPSTSLLSEVSVSNGAGPYSIVVNTAVVNDFMSDVLPSSENDFILSNLNDLSESESVPQGVGYSRMTDKSNILSMSNSNSVASAFISDSGEGMSVISASTSDVLLYSTAMNMGSMEFDDSLSSSTHHHVLFSDLLSASDGLSLANNSTVINVINSPNTDLLQTILLSIGKAMTDDSNTLLVSSYSIPSSIDKTISMVFSMAYSDTGYVEFSRDTSTIYSVDSGTSSILASMTFGSSSKIMDVSIGGSSLSSSSQNMDVHIGGSSLSSSSQSMDVSMGSSGHSSSSQSMDVSMGSSGHSSSSQSMDVSMGSSSLSSSSQSMDVSMGSSGHSSSSLSMNVSMGSSSLSSSSQSMDVSMGSSGHSSSSLSMDVSIGSSSLSSSSPTMDLSMRGNSLEASAGVGHTGLTSWNIPSTDVIQSDSYTASTGVYDHSSSLGEVTSASANESTAMLPTSVHGNEDKDLSASVSSINDPIPSKSTSTTTTTTTTQFITTIPKITTTTTKTSTTVMPTTTLTTTTTPTSAMSTTIITPPTTTIPATTTMSTSTTTTTTTSTTTTTTPPTTSNISSTTTVTSTTTTTAPTKPTTVMSTAKTTTPITTTTSTTTTTTTMSTTSRTTTTMPTTTTMSTTSRTTTTMPTTTTMSTTSRTTTTMPTTTTMSTTSRTTTTMPTTTTMSTTSRTTTTMPTTTTMSTTTATTTNMPTTTNKSKTTPTTTTTPATSTMSANTTFTSTTTTQATTTTTVITTASTTPATAFTTETTTTTETPTTTRPTTTAVPKITTPPTTTATKMATSTSTASPTSTTPTVTKTTTMPTTTTTSTTTTKTTTATLIPPSIRMSVQPAVLYSRASISCTLEGDNWQLVGFFRFFGGDFRAIAGFAVGGTNSVYINNALSASRQNTANSTTFTLTFNNITCEDETTYLCAANFKNGLNINDFQVQNVTLPPTPPVVAYPSDIQEGVPVTLTCESTVFASRGDVYWTTKRPGETVFFRENFPENTRSESVNSCEKTVSHTLTTSFNFSMNGTEIRCESLNPDVVSETKTLLIVPSDFCGPHPPNTLVTHPYDCNKYIICIPGLTTLLIQSCPVSLCFDQNEQRCVENTSNQGTGSDNPFSCDGKANGAYIPIQDSCTKYSWCVNGQAIEQTCATGTYFTEFAGPCTFDTGNAFCDESMLV